MDEEIPFILETIKKNLAAYEVNSNIETLENAYRLITQVRKEIGEVLFIHKRANR